MFNHHSISWQIILDRRLSWKKLFTVLFEHNVNQTKVEKKNDDVNVNLVKSINRCPWTVVLLIFSFLWPTWLWWMLILLLFLSYWFLLQRVDIITLTLNLFLVFCLPLIIDFVIIKQVVEVFHKNKNKYLKVFFFFFLSSLSRAHTF